MRSKQSPLYSFLPKCHVKTRPPRTSSPGPSANSSSAPRTKSARTASAMAGAQNITHVPCSSSPTDPRWASWNLGVFLCIRCSGIHRGMGTHISKVKSVDLDVWTPEQMQVGTTARVLKLGCLLSLPQSIQKWGNRLANLYWEAHLKPGHVPPEQCAFRRRMHSRNTNRAPQQNGIIRPVQVRVTAMGA